MDNKAHGPMKVGDILDPQDFNFAESIVQPSPGDWSRGDQVNSSNRLARLVVDRSGYVVAMLPTAMGIPSAEANANAALIIASRRLLQTMLNVRSYLDWQNDPRTPNKHLNALLTEVNAVIGVATISKKASDG